MRVANTCWGPYTPIWHRCPHLLRWDHPPMNPVLTVRVIYQPVGIMALNLKHCHHQRPIRQHLVALWLGMQPISTLLYPEQCSPGVLLRVACYSSCWFYRVGVYFLPSMFVFLASCRSTDDHTWSTRLINWRFSLIFLVFAILLAIPVACSLLLSLETIGMDNQNLPLHRLILDI